MKFFLFLLLIVSVLLTAHIESFSVSRSSETRNSFLSSRNSQSKYQVEKVKKSSSQPKMFKYANVVLVVLKSVSQSKKFRSADEV